MILIKEIKLYKEKNVKWSKIKYNKLYKVK